MRERRRWTVRDLRRDNRSVLLSSLFFDQPCSRPELSEATGLSPARSATSSRDLIDDGIVVEAGSVDSDGGRPRMLLQVNPDYGYIIGVDVGETRVRVELFDLTLTERAKADYPLDPRQHDVGVIVAGDPGRARRGAGRQRRQPVGGARRRRSASPASSRTGPTALVHGADLRLGAVPLERLLRAGTSLPLHIDNGAKTMGQAELWFGGGRGAQHAVVCLIGSGRRREHHRRRVRPPGVDVQRGRVGAYHGHGGRPPLPLRGARLPGGVRGRRGDPGPVRRARCPATDEETALAALIGLAATSPRGGGGPGGDRAVPGRRASPT